MFHFQYAVDVLDVVSCGPRAVGRIGLADFLSAMRLWMGALCNGVDHEMLETKYVFGDGSQQVGNERTREKRVRLLV